MNTLIIIFTFLVLASSSVPNTRVNTVNENDPEQQQLELCFIYSNLFGFNISSISNPKLYEVIGEWLGTPYRFSGNSKKGIDCSGLVCTLYKASYNRILAGSSRDMYRQTERISREEMKEGDLVFFMIKKSTISHVGIYLDKDRFVHSSRSNGVIISNLNDPYYKRYFYKAGRVKS